MLYFTLAFLAFYMDGARLALVPDESWATTTLRPYHEDGQITHFHVAKNHLIVFERAFPRKHVVIYRIDKKTKGQTELELVTAELPASDGRMMAVAGSRDGFFYTTLGDDGKTMLMAFKLQTMSTSEVLDLDRVQLHGLAAFANGDMVVRSTQMYELGVEYPRFGEYQAAESYSRFSVFFTSKDLRSITPLGRAPQGHVRERMTPAAVRKRQEFKAGSLGQTVGIFCHDEPGVELYNQKGERFATLVHPGNGVPSQRDFDENGEPLRMFIQDDIWIDDARKHLYVSDIANQVIWVLNFENEVIASIPTEFIAIELVMDEHFIYMRGRDDELMRYRKPKL